MSHICPVVLEVENHSLLVIASDSYDLQPQRFDSFVSTAGERYDFVISAQQPIGRGKFWFIAIFSPCEGITDFVDQTD